MRSFPCNEGRGVIDSGLLVFGPVIAAGADARQGRETIATSDAVRRSVDAANVLYSRARGIPLVQRGSRRIVSEAERPFSPLREMQSFRLAMVLNYSS
jgi:hypothetical protein